MWRCSDDLGLWSYVVITIGNAVVWGLATVGLAFLVRNIAAHARSVRSEPTGSGPHAAAWANLLPRPVPVAGHHRPA